MSLASTMATLQARWGQLAARERTLLSLAAALVLLAAVWLLFLSPIITTLRSAETQSRALDTQLQQMLALQTQVQSLQKQPPLAFDEALKALNLATQQTLGASAQVAVAGERASVTLQGVSPDALARWLAQARLNARSVPLEARLARTVSAKDNTQGTVWNGVLVMSLPAR
ncbi:MAG: type II secretion system protein M [Burkholderiales bacterium]|nr:type II secretion system protein M [Burkholderiales bacterium]